MQLLNKIKFDFSGKRSSSFHIISVDGENSLIIKFVWLFFNLLRNILKVNNFFIKSKISPNCLKVENIYWDNIEKNSSPSRIFSDIFWQRLDWDSIYNNLGSVNIFAYGET